MKLIGILLFAIVIVCTSCRSQSYRQNPDNPPVTTVILPQVAAVNEIAVAILDHAGNVVDTISGHVYCGEGLKQRPANRARIDLTDKDKVLTSLTTDMDGSYKLYYRKGLQESFQFSISSTCGNLKETLRRDIVRNHGTVDFWIK